MNCRTGDLEGLLQTSTVWSTGTDADTATPDWDYGNGNPAAAPASGNTSSGVAATSGSQGLDYDSVFSCGKPGHGVGRCPELDETFPYMLPAWSAEKVGVNYMMVSPRVTAERLRAENGD